MWPRHEAQLRFLKNWNLKQTIKMGKGWYSSRLTQCCGSQPHYLNLAFSAITALSAKIVFCNKPYFFNDFSIHFLVVHAGVSTIDVPNEWQSADSSIWYMLYPHGAARLFWNQPSQRLEQICIYSMTTIPYLREVLQQLFSFDRFTFWLR